MEYHEGNLHGFPSWYFVSLVVNGVGVALQFRDCVALLRRTAGGRLSPRDFTGRARAGRSRLHLIKLGHYDGEFSVY